MKWSFKNVYDVQQLLKQFGIFVYVGNRLWDLEIMMDELKKLHQNNLIEDSVFLSAMTILKKEHPLEQERQDADNKKD